MRRVIALLALLFAVSCATTNRQTYDNCDTQSMRIRLNVRNYNANDVLITLIRGSGGGRELRPRMRSLGRDTYNMSRNDFQQGNFFRLVQKTGPNSGPAFVELEPVLCSTGTLEIGASLNLSFFIGAKWE